MFKADGCNTNFNDDANGRNLDGAAGTEVVTLTSFNGEARKEATLHVTDGASEYERTATVLMITAATVPMITTARWCSNQPGVQSRQSRGHRLLCERRLELLRHAEYKPTVALLSVPSGHRAHAGELAAEYISKSLAEA